MNENNGSSTMSFDRMRNMLMRAAEIRESEQQQIFDALDEIHARMSPLDSVGSMRKRISELPDKTEVGVLAERLDEALAKLEATDTAIASIGRAVESIVDKLATPFAQLDGRLDGVAGRFEGVAGRMDGLEDKLAHIHKRLDELDLHLDKQDSKLEELPRTVRTDMHERVNSAESSLRGELENARQAAATASDSLAGKVDKSHLLLHGKIDEAKEAVDASDRLDAQTARLDTLDGGLNKVTSRVEEVVSRLETSENTLSGRLTELAGSVAERPTADTVREVIRRAHDGSERQYAGHLDEAMATFAELILGGGAPTPAPSQLAVPRQPARRTRKAPAKVSKSGNNGTSPEDSDDDD
ncbi:MAG: PA containing protein [Sciscionella sp.]